ncbi:MAG: DUF4038 domain-containing protein [Candidatus Hinthialibacter antarcticus]|nr:DUF4038 domain-containing protein [Candidatus Hinthialibacter antarcticus]
MISTTRFTAILITALTVFSLAAANADVHQWGRFETNFSAEKTVSNPIQEIRLEVDFTAPDGSIQTRLGFWDGEKTWKVRFSPTQTGEWKYSTRCVKGSDKGLNNQSGKFTCTAYSGENPLYQHGELQLSKNRRYIQYADETPYFFLADTVWNGPLFSDIAGWVKFLTLRQQQNFNAIQFVTTQWRAAEGDANGNPAFSGVEKISINEKFYQRMDDYFDAINQHGMVAVPVLLWAINGKQNPGNFLPEDQRILLAEYQVARYGAHQTIWFLAGDGEYRKEKAGPWRRIGRAVFGDNHHRLATMHPAGSHWVADEFRNEKWFSFLGYQSGHGDSDGNYKWTFAGPASKEWKNQPPRPIINIEPNYEGILAYQSKKPHPALHVRRASYWSLLCAPPAGITYGAHGIWGWHFERGPAIGHNGNGDGDPWHIAMNLPGANHMAHLYDFFTSINWWELHPDQSLVANQQQAAKDFIVAARSKQGDLAVLYAPGGGAIRVNAASLKLPMQAKWFNPRSGSWTDEGPVKEKVQHFTAPNNEDWILYLQ